MKSTEVAAILAILLVSATTAVNADVQGSVTLFNLVGDPITADCFGPSAHHGPVNLGVEESHMWQFPISFFSKGWTCHFEWIDNASCVVGRGCDIHKQDVKVWEGVFGARRNLMLNLTPCNDCLWQIKADGFYRANLKDHVYSFIQPWH